MKHVLIDSDEQFARLLKALADDSTTAAIHWRLLKNLYAALEPHAREMNETWTFWSLTIEAHQATVFHALARLYDGDPRALSLGRLLHTVERNLHLFDKEHFRKRLKDNPHIESLAEAHTSPDLKQLHDDLAAAIANRNPLVRQLHGLRNVRFAHRDAESVRTAVPNWLKGLKREDVDTLIDRAMTLVNRYSGLFSANYFSSGMVGEEDYERLLSLVRKGLDSADIERAKSD